MLPGRQVYELGDSESFIEHFKIFEFIMNGFLTSVIANP